MKLLALLTFTVVIVVGGQQLQAQEKSSEITPLISSSVITSIEITGLKRTRQHIAQYPLEKFLGRDASLDLNEVHAAVIATGILQPLEVELLENEGALVLHITVEEKWSIFPVPLVMANSDDFSFGLFFADTNAFGLQDTMALGAIYGYPSWMAVALYQFTPNRRGLPGWSSFVMYSSQERKDVDRNEKTHRLYSSNQLRFSLGLDYPLSEYFSTSLGFSFTDVSLKENAVAVNQPGGDAKLLGISPSLSMKDDLWDGFLLSRRSLNLAYEYNHAIVGSSFHQLEFSGIYEHSLVPGFRINFRSGAIWKSTASDSGIGPLFEEGPQRAHVDILPHNFSARAYAGFSLGLEKHLFKVSWGTLSVMGSWQCVFSNGPISGFEFDHGPSVVTRFYLSRLALPAFGAGFAYNMNSGLFQFAFSIGMSL